MIRNQLLGLVLELIVQIDVIYNVYTQIDIQIEDQEEDLDDAEEEPDIFTMDVEEQLKDRFLMSRQDEDDYTDSDTESLLCIVSNAKVMTSKLDSLMCILLEYISEIDRGRISDEAYDDIFSEIFDGILLTFDRIMLPTHKLKSAQFVLFYACSLSPETFPADFMGLLVSHLMDISNSSVTRMASSSYLGSFIARAKFIKIESVRQCLTLLNHQCQSFVDNHETTITGKLEVVQCISSKADRYGVLYASVQAILYIFCFKWKQLMLLKDKPLSGSFPPELHGFQRVLMSKFNPLRVFREL